MNVNSEKKVRCKSNNRLFKSIKQNKKKTTVYFRRVSFVQHVTKQKKKLHNYKSLYMYKRYRNNS